MRSPTRPCLSSVAALAAMLLCSSLAAAPPGSPPAAGQPVTVQVQPAAELLLPANRTAPAEVLSPNDAMLSAEVGARVARIAADVGATVARGELLVELDCTDLRLAAAQADAQLAAAAAGVALAEQRLERGRQLSGKAYISADELLELSTAQQAAAAEREVAAAQQAIAARQVDKCRITAPFDGVVVERQAQVGALASPGTPLLRLIDRSEAEVQAQVPAADAATLPQATHTVFESQGRRYAVELRRLSEVIDPRSRTRVARFGFVDAAPPTGASGTLRWNTSAGQLPAELLVQRDGSVGVFVADDGIARFVPIEGALAGRPAEVSAPPGDLIVVQGQQQLHDEMPIRVAAD